jgi:hypothetical protein
LIVEKERKLKAYDTNRKKEEKKKKDLLSFCVRRAWGLTDIKSSKR